MTTGLVLIVAILVLGGVIATVGDRLGMRVGKARLSLFRLRPRQTATIITILTGSIISASTFAILFAVSDQLRTGVFELGAIQDDLRDARRDLQDTTTEKEQIGRELNQSRRRQQDARRRLSEINRSLRRTRARQAETEAQLDRSQTQLSRTQTQLGQIQGNYERAQTLLRSISGQAAQLSSEIKQLQGERQALIAQRDAVREQVTQRDVEIAVRDTAIAEREVSLQNLESQRTVLEREVQAFERELQGLRLGNVALLRNQSLAAGIVRIVNPNAAPTAIEQLLVQANQTALERIRPGTEDSGQQVISVTNAQIEQLSSQIQDGRDYVVRILSQGNYVVGEPCVLAGEACVNWYGAAALNQLVFVAGQVVATTTVDPTTMTDERLIERIQLLVAAAQFRARQAGIVSDTIQVADGRSETIVNFFNQIKQYNQPVDLQAVAADITYTAGPLTIELYASQNNQVLFGTQ